MEPAQTPVIWTKTPDQILSIINRKRPKTTSTSGVLGRQRLLEGPAAPRPPIARQIRWAIHEVQRRHRAKHTWGIPVRGAATVALLQLYIKAVREPRAGKRFITRICADPGADCAGRRPRGAHGSRSQDIRRSADAVTCCAARECQRDQDRASVSRPWGVAPAGAGQIGALLLVTQQGHAAWAACLSMASSKRTRTHSLRLKPAPPCGGEVRVGSALTVGDALRRERTGNS